jgi:2,5-diketo-D-gluconate reductase B
MDFVEVQGVRIPKIGIGTWNMRGETCRRAVLSALELGYRHIDTAEIYGNEHEVGRAMKESGVPRGKLFIVTKVWNNHHQHDAVLKACEASLRRLDTPYIDLYLIHWPGSNVPVEETLGAMELLIHQGKVHNIGVSNFTTIQLQEARAASPVPIFCDQVKFSPINPQSELLAYCQKNEILLTAYTPLEKGSVSRNQTLRDIGRKYDKSAAQVALCWLIEQEKVAAIPKAAGVGHQQENMNIFDFSLASEDREAIGRLG